MMNSRSIALACGLALLAASCSKDKSYEPDQSLSPADSTFQPVSSGSEWHYQDSLQGDFTLTATDGDTTIEGIPYHIFLSRQDTSDTDIPTYFGKAGISYYGSGLMTGLENISLLYLKDTTVNSSWTQTIAASVPSLGNVSATIQSQLTGVELSRTVNGKKYSHVSSVSFQVTVPVPIVGNITYAAGTWYAARGVGVIEMEVESDNSVIGSFSLLDYTIK